MRRRWVKYDFIPARGSSGEILLLWDEKKLDNMEVNKGGLMLVARFRNMGNGMEWRFQMCIVLWGKGLR